MSNKPPRVHYVPDAKNIVSLDLYDLIKRVYGPGWDLVDDSLAGIRPMPLNALMHGMPPAGGDLVRDFFLWEAEVRLDVEAYADQPRRFLAEAGQDPSFESFDAARVMIGSPLATVIKTAKDLQDTEDSELNRRKASQFWATFLVKKASSDGLELGGPAGVGDAPASRGPDKSTRNLAVGMGDMAVVEEGYEPKMVQPAGEGAGFQTAVRIQTSLITNTVGIPYHEAMNDWDAVPERAMRPASVSMKRRMLKDRGKRERLLNWMWRWFVRVCMEEGLWTPPPGATTAEIFKVTWRWPVIHTVTPEREMKTGAELIKLGLMTPEHFVEDFVGEEYKEFLRRLVTNMAQAKVQGSKIYDDVFDPEVPIAADYMSVAEEEEAVQRQLVRTARLDRSARRKPAA